MEPWQRARDTRIQGEGRPAADGVAFLVFAGDEGDRTGGERTWG